MLSGLVALGAAGGAAARPVAGATWLRSGLVRENYRGPQLAFPPGRVLIALLADRPGAAGRARRPRRPRPARSRAAPLDRLRARRRLARPARRRARPRRRPRTPRAAGAGTPARCAAAASRPARSRRSGRSRWPPTRSPGRGREGIDYVADLALLLLATNLFNLLDLRPGRVEKAFGAAAGRPLPRRLDRRAARAPRASSSARSLVGAWFTLRERAMLGDTGSNLVGALAGVCDADHPRRHGPLDRPRGRRRVDDLTGSFGRSRRRSNRFRHCAG